MEPGGVCRGSNNKIKNPVKSGGVWENAQKR